MENIHKSLAKSYDILFGKFSFMSQQEMSGSSKHDLGHQDSLPVFLLLETIYHKFDFNDQIVQFGLTSLTLDSVFHGLIK